MQLKYPLSQDPGPDPAELVSYMPLLHSGTFVHHVLYTKVSSSSGSRP